MEEVSVCFIEEGISPNSRTLDFIIKNVRRS